MPAKGDTTPLEERLNEKWVEDTNGCWIWMGSTNPYDYGMIWDSKKEATVRAHRASHRIHNGEIPDDEPYILHSCGVRRCVNPDHLRTGTAKENAQDAVENGKYPTGSEHGNSKLAEVDVLEIRERYEDPDETYKSIAEDYPVNFTTIAKVIKGELWGHL